MNTTPSTPTSDGARERAWNRKRADALGWSIAQADLMAAAAAVQLQYRDGALHYIPQPGRTGRPIEPARLLPLVDAGLLAVTEPFGPNSKRVSVTADGREALHLWRTYRPTPVPRGPHMDREALSPLLGGELHTNQCASAEEQYALRLAQRDEATCPASQPGLPTPPRLAPTPSPMPALTIAPDSVEQLDLFGSAS